MEPHPLFSAFVGAALEQQERKMQKEILGVGASHGAV
jgi:hypothetical protein